MGGGQWAGVGRGEGEGESCFGHRTKPHKLSEDPQCSSTFKMRV